MIIEFILEGFVPSLTSGIRKIHAKTKSDINIIIGSNGASKSSILRELNPFPPDSSKFVEGGKKDITLLHNGNTYHLVNTYGKEAGHIFEVNGVDLNTGNTATAQRMLAEQHFGMTQSMCKVLTGLHYQDLFTFMSPTKRKEFLMDLYPNDTTYAMGVFIKLKNEYNSLRGALKNQIARFAAEKLKLDAISKMNEAEMLHLVNSLDQEIRDHLLLLGSLQDSEEYPEIHKQRDIIIQKLNRIIGCKISNPNGFTKESLKSIINQNSRSLEIAKSKQEYLSRTFAELQEQVSMINVNQDPKQLEARIKLLEGEITRYNDTKENTLRILNDHPTLLNNRDTVGFISAIQTFEDHVNTMVLSSTPELTGIQYARYIEDADKLGNERTKTKQMLETKQHQLAHYNSVESINCPDCKHAFKVGVTEKDIYLIKNDIDGLEKMILKYDDRIQELEKKIDNDREWFQRMGELMNWIKRQHLTQFPLQDLINEYSIGKIEGSHIREGIVSLIKYNDAYLLSEQYDKEKVILESQLLLLKQNYIGGLIEKIKLTEEDLIWQNQSVRLLTHQILRHKLILTDIVQYEDDCLHFKLSMKDYASRVQKHLRFSLKRNVTDIVTEKTSQKNSLMSEIIHNKSISSVVESIDKDIQRLKRRIRIVKSLMDGICPNKGLIGKLMSDFIKVFCGNMNAIIKEFSHIPLLIKPCTKENGDLTYKFPVINGVNTENSDISECSAGESEILNFVSRKVGMRYKPNWLPLFMDEVGAFLDEINRTRFFEYIQKSMADKEHDQLFMISHYVAQHGIFHDPNIIGIKYEGLTVNGKVNINTTIN